MELGIPVNKLRIGEVGDLNPIFQSVKKIMNENFHTLKAAHITPNELITKIKKQYNEFGIKYLIIDYLQLLSGTKTKFSNRDTEIGEITRTLKNIALELDIPIILLSQLNRSVEATSMKIPEISHLRESGNIEQDADMILLLWRPEVYKINKYDFKGTGLEIDKIDTKNICQIHCAKGRNSGTGHILTFFDSQHTKFTDLDLYHTKSIEFNDFTEE
jgi:replicative DNA helicase